MDYLGHKVSRLIRISYGPFQLGNLEVVISKRLTPAFLQISLALAITQQMPSLNLLFLSKNQTIILLTKEVDMRS